MLNVTAVVIPSIMESCYLQGLCMADRITNSKLTIEDTGIESWDSRPRPESVYHDVRTFCTSRYQLTPRIEAPYGLFVDPFASLLRRMGHLPCN